ncbi:MAG: hypothetical protein LBN04_08080 [Oscillospiraceae bacterium]|jgi:transcription antitermination factor NusG|nr:hypothetical protein [Oscillospiraceae bacterium]
MPDSSPAMADASYGCLFCQTGYEKAVARHIQDQYDNIAAVALWQVQHHSEQGQKTFRNRILLPGYVFVRMPSAAPTDFSQAAHVVRLLRDAAGDWVLQGRDAQFARWVFDCGGLLGVSDAYRVGGAVLIAHGPLKDLEGNLIKIDRRNRNGLVELSFNGRVWRVWLAFEWLKEQEEDQCTYFLPKKE